jgi:DNA-binding NarL/FixJ family response regulator
MSKTIHLLVIDDHVLFREGLIRLLAAEADFEVVGACDGIREAVELLANNHVDLVLLDYDLGAEQALPILEEIRRMAVAPKVLMVTAGMNRAGMMSMLDRGASGIFLKHSPPAQLVEAIRSAAEGEMWLDPRVVKHVIEGASRGGEAPAPQSTLSAREKAVLRGVLEGQSNKVIAAAMDLSESSVKAVLQQLFGKTGVRTRSQLVRLALERHSHDWLADDPQPE